MDAWELDFAWLQVRHLVKERFKRDSLPDLNGMLFLIGIQELGRWSNRFSKEEKQDLMHIAICRLLSYDGYYTFVGRDADGWPHWQKAKPLRAADLQEQEEMLKKYIIMYFQELQASGEGLTLS